jgi:hypothetical protein
VSLPILLERAGTFVADYERQISMVVAEEHYTQTSRGDGSEPAERRILRSDVLVVDAGPVGWLGFRDVFEVDGRPVRDHQNRLLDLVVSPVPDALAQARRMADEGARFNLGGAVRTISMPTLALVFLRKDEQRRSIWKLGDRKKVDGHEAVELRFAERERPGMISTRDGAAARGRFWIEPDSGRVVRSEFMIDSAGMSGSVIVTFGPAPKITPWLPLTMDDDYRSSTQTAAPGAAQSSAASRAETSVPAVHIEGHATYRNFRTFGVETNTIIRK